MCYALTGPGGTVHVAVQDGCLGYPGNQQCCLNSDCSQRSSAAKCDWCAAEQHPHFDLSKAAFDALGCAGGSGACVLESVVPYECTFDAAN